MKEEFTFRFYADDAAKYLGGAAIGTPIHPGFLRSIACHRGDEIWNRLAHAFEKSRADGVSMFASVSTRLIFSASEYAGADYFRLCANRMIEASFEEFGTEHSDGAMCSLCGAGTFAQPPLHLPTRFLKPSKAILETLGGELLVSRMVADALAAHRTPGVELDEVLPIGGAERKETWFRLRVTGGNVQLSRQTTASLVPFEIGWPNESTCGHVVGYGVQSQVWIDRPAIAHGGFYSTHQHLGVRRGLLRPARIVIIGRDAFEVLSAIGFSKSCEPVRVA